ncbi:unnamed protein product [Closterium sp. Naga37s-1]|nr:unnamed protein product [Closterium sp. Naga37s-1]
MRTRHAPAQFGSLEICSKAASIQPINQHCDHRSPSLWQLLCQRHLLHPSGLPSSTPTGPTATNTHSSQRPSQLPSLSLFFPILSPTFSPPCFPHKPIYQDCDRSSPSLWRLLRRLHLLHPSGLPLFNPDRTYRQHHAPLSAAEARTFPPDWLVVLASRAEGGARARVNKLEVEAMLVRRFGRERVVVFDGSMPILQGGWRGAGKVLDAAVCGERVVVCDGLMLILQCEVCMGRLLSGLLVVMCEEQVVVPLM